MISALYIAGKPGEGLQVVDTAHLRSGAGIIGDRNFDKSQWPGQNITFIGAEAIAAFNREYDQTIDFKATRRNVITTGVDLNALVGKTFTIGGVLFKGVELCEPCRNLGLRLENENISCAAVVKAFLYSGGLRADVCSDGAVSVGMKFVIDA